MTPAEELRAAFIANEDRVYREKKEKAEELAARHICGHCSYWNSGACEYPLWKPTAVYDVRWKSVMPHEGKDCVCWTAKNQTLAI